MQVHLGVPSINSLFVWGYLIQYAQNASISDFSIFDIQILHLEPSNFAHREFKRLLYTSYVFTPQPKLGSRGIVVIRRAGGRAGVTTAPLPLSRAQLLSDRGQIW